MFESRENTALSAAILYLAVCVCGVMNKAGIFDISVHCVMTNLFLLFIGKKKKSAPTGLQPEELKL